MATRKAVANGNFGSTATWSGGVVPVAGDTVYANGYAISIDGDVVLGGSASPLVAAGSFSIGSYYEVVSLGTTAWNAVGGSGVVGSVFVATAVGSGTGVARALGTLTTLPNANAAVAALQGGGFARSAAWRVVCDLRAGSTTCLTVTGVDSLEISGVRIIGGTGSGVANARALDFGSTGVLQLTSCDVRSQGAGGCNGVRNFGGGSVQVVSCSLTGANNVVAIQNDVGALAITGSTSAGGIGNGNTPAVCTIENSVLQGSGSNAYGVTNGTGTLILSNCVCTGSITTNAPAVLNSSTGSVVATNCDWVATALAYGFQGSQSSANVQLSGRFYDHWSGVPAVFAPKWRLGVAPSRSVHRVALSGVEDSYLQFYTADNEIFGQPSTQDVRSGVVYGGGALIGTCAVPLPEHVAMGIPVGSGVGTATLSAITIQTAVGEALEAAGISADLVARLGNVATGQIVAAMIQQAHEV